MAAVLTEPRLEKESTNEMPEDGDDEVEDLQEANEVSSSKKKKKKKKKKKGQFSLIVTHFRGTDMTNLMTVQIHYVRELKSLQT